MKTSTIITFDINISNVDLSGFSAIRPYGPQIVFLSWYKCSVKEVKS